MKKRSVTKMILDLLMTILLPLLMIQALAGEELHEWIGILMLIIFIAHHLINFSWHKNLLKGKYNVIRGLGILINAGILICMVFSAISGIVLSQYVFVFLDIDQGISFARSAHMIGTHWMFVLISLHLGIHIKIIKGYLEQSIKRKLGKVSNSVVCIMTGIAAIYGLKIFIDTKLWQYMFYQAQYMFYDFTRTAIGVYLDYVFMMILFIEIGYFMSNKLHLANRSNR